MNDIVVGSTVVAVCSIVVISSCFSSGSFPSTKVSEIGSSVFDGIVLNVV